MVGVYSVLKFFLLRFFNFGKDAEKIVHHLDFKLIKKIMIEHCIDCNDAGVGFSAAEANLGVIEGKNISLCVYHGIDLNNQTRIILQKVLMIVTLNLELMYGR